MPSKKTEILKAAIEEAEFRGQPDKNRWIRTEAKPKKRISTAFGPQQITKNLMDDYLNRNLFPKEDAEKIKTDLIPMMENFKADETKEGAFGYGGTGNITEAQKEIYNKMAEDMIEKESKDKTMEQFIKRWRGVDRKKDPKYYEALESASIAMSNDYDQSKGS